MKRKEDLDSILARIEKGDPFESQLNDGSLSIKIEDYVPYICLAIHDGHRLRPALEKKCRISARDRRKEEDPHTHCLISSLPVVIQTHDSRYEYDLNRPPSEAIYTTAWGKKVWTRSLTPRQRRISLEKHAAFYRVVDVLVRRLEKTFGSVLVFDIHSYNPGRLTGDSPLFNLGTRHIDRDRFGRVVDFWLKCLSRIRLPGTDVQVAENEVFEGKGHLLRHLTRKFPNTLVLATEIKKIYCNEKTGAPYPLMLDTLTSQIKKAIVPTARFHARRHTTFLDHRNHRLLSRRQDRNLMAVDQSLFEIVKNFEIMYYVNPVNLEESRKQFFTSRYTVNPRFRYTQLRINPFEFKRKLYNVPVGSIQDISLRILYQEVIDSYADKVDILASIGTDRFLYNSLRYFGEPKPGDIKAARYLLHCSNRSRNRKPDLLNARQVYRHFQNIIKKYGFECHIEISKNVVSKVLIVNSRKTILIREDAQFSRDWLEALSEHEIGVHMVTTINSRLQPLAVFRVGTPLNTHTQEGLAMLAEYLSGNLTVSRLKMLALRVLALDEMLRGSDFKQTFCFLMDTGILNRDQSFYLTARIFRGGGFTKDYLYLKGFRDLLREYRRRKDLFNLLVGKTTLKYAGLIREMIDRHIINPPRYLTFALQNPAPPDPIIDYILEGAV